jgi:hypothetical protein
VTPSGRVIVDVACRVAAMFYCDVCPCILVIGNAAFRLAAMFFCVSAMLYGHVCVSGVVCETV